MHLLCKIMKTTGVFLLTAALCFPAFAGTKGEAARSAYADSLSLPILEDEETASFQFKKPVDLNGDGIAELIVSQLTSRPVVYAYYDNAPHIIYQGRGDGAVMQYFPDAAVFVESSGRMGEYQVRYVRFDGRRARVLLSFEYEGEPLSPVRRNEIFDQFKVKWYKGNIDSGESISREEFEQLLEKVISGSAVQMVSNTLYPNSEENRQRFILDSPSPTESEPGRLDMTSVENISEGILITWASSANADGYVVYRKKDGSDDFVQIKVLDNPEITSFTDPEIQGEEPEGNVYRYTVRGYMPDESAQSRIYNKDGLAVMRLSAPVITRCESAPENMSFIKWTENEEASGYTLQYGTDPDFNDCVTVNLLGSDTNSYTGEDLEEDAVYYYRVQATGKKNGVKSASGWSETESMTARFE